MHTSPQEPAGAGRVTISARVAAIVVGLEGLGIVALVIWQIAALLSGDTDSLTSAIALAVLSAVGAAAVLAFAVAVWRGQSWGRSGGDLHAHAPLQGRHCDAAAQEGLGQVELGRTDDVLAFAPELG